MRTKQILAWIGLAMGVAVLGFELWLQVGRRAGNADLLAASLRYLSFFTNLSNFALVLVYAAALVPAAAPARVALLAADARHGAGHDPADHADLLLRPGTN